MVEVGRDQRRVVGREHALEAPGLRRLLDRGIDLFGGRLARGDELEVDHRHVLGRHPDGGAVELAVELGQDAADGLRGAGRGRDQRLSRRAGAPEIAVQRVENALVARVGVDRRHIPLGNAHRLVEHSGHGSEAVGGAGRVGNHLVRLAEPVLVHAVDDGDVLIRRGRRDKDAFGAGGEVFLGVRPPGEQAGAFHRHVDAELRPRKVRRVAFGENPDAVTVYVETGFGDPDPTFETPVAGIVFEQMGVDVGRAEIVDRDDPDVVAS